MNRLMVIAQLKQGAHDRAETLLAEGPPFDPEELRFHRHGAYLTSSEIVFLFEAHDVEWVVNDIVDDPRMASAFAAWSELIDGTPRLAHERFYWSRESDKLGVGLGA